MKPPPRPAAETKWPSLPLEWPRAAGHVEELLAAVEARKKRRRRRVTTAAGVAAATVLALAVVWFEPRATAPAPIAASPATTRMIVIAPEHRSLPDGTRAEVKAGAELVVDFARGESGPRRVALTRGTAFFSVTPDPERPFVVETGGVRFRAVGTAFSVEHAAAFIELVVSEGSVAFERNGTGGAEQPLMVIAGQRLRVESGAAKPETLAEEAVSAALQWRIPRLEFNETPLRDVVAALSAHSGRRVTLSDPALGKIEISGALRADRLDPLFTILDNTYGLVADRQPDGSVVLRSGSRK